MEDVLEVYARPYDAAHPVVCLDEPSRQLLGETREPLPVGPSHPARHDPEYVRGGVAQLFMVTEPLRGWRHVTVGARRTRREFAQCVKDLVDRQYPDAERIVLVLDHRAISTARHRCMRPSRPPRPGAWRRSWRCTIPPSMGAG